MKRKVPFYMQTKVLVVLAIVFIVSLGYVQIKSSSELAPETALPQPTLGPVTQPSVIGPTEKPKLTLNGTYSCEYASSSAFIDRKKVYYENKLATQSSKMMFDGDCLYMWDDKKRAGSQKCGLGQMAQMADQVSGLTKMFGGNAITESLFGPEALESIIPQEHLNSANKRRIVKGLMDSCKPAKSVDQSVFVVPKNITFTEE